MFIGTKRIKEDEMDDLSKYMHVFFFFFVSLLPLLMSFIFCRGALTVSTLVRNLTHFDLSEQSASTKAGYLLQ